MPLSRPPLAFIARHTSTPFDAAPDAFRRRPDVAIRTRGNRPSLFSRTIRGGCFAIGLLILVTQFSLAAEFAARGMEPPRLGDSYETDLILNGAASELIADAFFEAIFVIGWRVIRCKTDIPPDDPW